MTGVYPVTSSILSAQALIDRLLSRYELGPIHLCAFYTGGLNDTYIVKCGNADYYLRIYRVGWRRRCDIEAELEFIDLLSSNGMNVSTAVATSDGEFILDVDAPEGLRYAVLFKESKGTWFDKSRESQALKFGQAAARMHNLTDGWRAKSERIKLDLDHLLDAPYKSVADHYAPHATEMEQLASIVRQLKSKAGDILLPEGDAGTSWGICHGDLHWGNVHFDADDNPAIFDFDCCGYGWRAYDMSVMWWNMEMGKVDDAQKYWFSFLDGYRRERAVSDRDLAAVELFVAMRQIWMMGLHVKGSKHWGRAMVGDEYFKYHFGFLKDWVTAKGLADVTA